MPKVKGGPINCILYKAVSVQINISCRDLTLPTMRLPEDNLREPAVFVLLGSKSISFSWSLKAISIGSTLPVRTELTMGSEPKIIKCLSFSEVIACSPTVGTKLAPVIPDSSAALVPTPLFSSHL